MKGKATKIGDLEIYGSTPFIHKLVNNMRHTKKVIARGEDVYQDGIPVGTTFMGISKEVDNNQFIKFFDDGLRILFDLGKSDMKVFTYIMSLTMMKSDKINFSPAECIKTTGLSRASVVRSVINLANVEIIARTDMSNVYYINPTVFFKGDRMMIVREYRRKKNEDFEQKILHDSEGTVIEELSPTVTMIPKAVPKPEENEN